MQGLEWGHRMTVLSLRSDKFPKGLWIRPDVTDDVYYRELKQLGRERQRRLAAEFLAFRFPFSCLYSSCITFSFCLKVCEYENLEAMFLKLHED